MKFQGIIKISQGIVYLINDETSETFRSFIKKHATELNNKKVEVTIKVLEGGK